MKTLWRASQREALPSLTGIRQQLGIDIFLRFIEKIVDLNRWANRVADDPTQVLS